MAQYTIDIYVDDWSGYGHVADATVTIDGITKITGSDGYLQFININEGEKIITVTKVGYTDYIYSFYLDENKTMGIPFKKETCISQPECELDSNNNKTGYMLDGCGGKFLSPHCTPECETVWSCELDANGKNTGYLLDGCGGRTLDESTCPTTQCTPVYTCELDETNRKTGYMLDGCGGKNLDPQCTCEPNPVCQTDEDGINTGFIVDGCGGITEDKITCPIPSQCSQIQCTFIMEDPEPPQL
jgi:hypothetical protein